MFFVDSRVCDLCQRKVDEWTWGNAKNRKGKRIVSVSYLNVCSDCYSKHVQKEDEKGRKIYIEHDGRKYYF